MSSLRWDCLPIISVERLSAFRGSIREASASRVDGWGSQRCGTRRDNAGPCRSSSRSGLLSWPISHSGELFTCRRRCSLPSYASPRRRSWLEQAFDARFGLLLTGSIAALVYAYLVRFLTVSLGAVEASLSKITPAMDDAARSLGYGQPCHRTFERREQGGPVEWLDASVAGVGGSAGSIARSSAVRRSVSTS